MESKISPGASRTTRAATGFEHRIRVRYGDCDMQGVVFNPTYLTYVDDAVDVWFQTALGRDYLERFSYVVKRATVEWAAPARAQDVLTLTPRVARWGNTSMDVTVPFEVTGRPIAEAVLTLVSVAPGGHAPVPVPRFVRDALGDVPPAHTGPA